MTMTHKVDPKMERVRCVEGRASDEPFGAKRHRVIHLTYMNSNRSAGA